MSIDLKTVLQHKAINQWKLFWLVFCPDVRHDGYRDDGRRPVRCGCCLAYDLVFCTLGSAFYLPGGGYICAPGAVPRPVADVAAAQPEIYRHVFCGCNGVARLVHLHDVDLLP